MTGASPIGGAFKRRTNSERCAPLQLPGRFDSTSIARYTAAAGSGGVTGDYFAGYRFVDLRKFTLTTTFDF